MTPVAAWVLVNLLHLIASGCWTARWRQARPGASADQAFFVGTLAWLGSLTVVLHMTAAVGALSLPWVTLGLIGAHAALWAWPSIFPASTTGASEPAPAAGVGRALDWIGAAVVAVVAVQWVVGDVRDPFIRGTDAAHYHVPHAIDFALGAGLFEPAATGHLYPSGASVVAAWFILPTHNALVVDSAALPWFVLLAASCCWLFRLATDASGLAVVPWWLLAVLTLPLVRESVPFSADLPFAAACLALFAHVLSWTRLPVTPGGVAAASLLLGLLLGTKATGVPCAALLAGLALALAVRAARAGRVAWPRAARRTLAVALVCADLAVGAGGIWQAANWWKYGSPIAPMGVRVAGVTIFPGASIEEMSPNLSLAEEIKADGALRTWRFGRRYLRDLAGPWPLIVAWLVPLTLVDAIVALRRRRHAEAAFTRALLVACAVVGAVVIGWMLVNAPWTSLRWTSGRSLRYALPFILLGFLVSLLAAFPLSRPRWASPRAFALWTIGLAAAALATAIAGRLPPEQDPAGHLLVFTPGAVTLAVCGMAALGLAAMRRVRVGPMAAALSAVALLATLPASVAIDARARELTNDAEARLAARAGRSVTLSPTEAAAAIIHEDWRRSGARGIRRVFVAARFDAPLDLQDAAYATLVYEVREPSLAERLLPERPPGAGPSDYLVGSIAETETARGSPMVSYYGARHALVAIGDAAPYRVWRMTRAGGAVALAISPELSAR